MRIAVIVAAACLSTVGLSAVADVEASIKKATNIPAEELVSALKALAHQRGLQFVFQSEVVGSARTEGAVGELTTTETLERLLSGTGLTYRYLDEKTVTIVPVGTAPEADSPSTQTLSNPLDSQAGEHLRDQLRLAQASGTEAQAETTGPADNGGERKPVELAEVIVTGSHIRGVPPSSPTIVISQQQMREAGQSDLGDVARSIPLNFNGGQNPGVGQEAGGVNNQNFNSGSAINLRGLGPDATLTLLNGRRLSYDAFTQAVDISAIPMAAVESIQIVADGASALYGSDAVGGVANIILKRDYDGLGVDAHVGAATRGGGLRQDYVILGGNKWSTGGYLASFEYERQLPVTADQRDFTRYMPLPADLLGYERHNNFLITGHQEVSPTATLSVDAVYNERWSTQRYSPSSPVQVTSSPVAESYFLSPTLTVRLPANWSLSINGLYGQDNTRTNQYAVQDGALVQYSGDCYCNSIAAGEVDADGKLFALPAGEARMALGGGYRDNRYRGYSFSGVGATNARRTSYYAFGELFVPLVAAENDVAAINSLSLSAALRHEHYGDLGGITTPKLGIIYAPSPDLEIKGSWGRSFKEPTLLQEREPPIAYLFPAAELGAVGYPDTATALATTGGNRALKPERAETWSATLALHPRLLEGFHADLSYFNIVYRDRVMEPISNFFAAFSDPLYREFVTLNPTAAQQQQLLAASPAGFLNFTGAPYDPAQVMGIANVLYANIARQRIHGVDLSSDYGFEWRGDEFGVTGQASWLTSEQQNSVAAPMFPLAGTVFNPPRLRARAGGTWRHASFTTSAFVNYVGGVTDTQQTPSVSGGSMTTIDAAVIYKVARGPDIVRGLDLSLSVSNLTDQAPPYLSNLFPSLVNYDSTNYSALGRYVTLSVSKHW
jgi:outer membrane receptor protein involved in Fe transport